VSKLYACIISEDAKNDKDVLLSIAHGFASRIETLEDGVLFDVSGLENLMGNADEIARRIERKLKEHNLQANAAVAASAHTAILLARQKDRLEHTAKANEFSRLALKELDIDPDTLDIFEDLGIRKISDLKRVPIDDLINRYGQKFRDVIDIIEQKGGRILTPNVKESSLTWSYDLDFPVEDFEQLIFIVNHGLDKLFSRISYSGFSTEQLDITLGLRKKKERCYEIKTSFPTLEKSFWLKLVNLRIALDPPESEIISVRVVSYFTRPRPSQRGLYAVSRPEPENLLLTVNKLKKLVGEENVGVPVLLNERLSEPFAIDPEQLPQGSEKLEIRSENLTAAFNYFRPPLPAAVTVENKRLLHIKTAFWSGRVKRYSGMWKKNSHWWNRPWNDREWDIEVEERGVFRLGRNEDEWFLFGEYD
jgi:protein ImuB